MTVSYHDAHRTSSHAVIGLAGPSGSGKSFTAMRLARGLAGTAPFFVIDSENGKSEQLYGDLFHPWRCGVLEPPYTPEAYVEAFDVAVAAGAEVIVVDSMSDEHDGEGGLLDIQEAYLNEKAGDNAFKREALSFPAWKVAKQRHERLVRQLRVPRCHLVVCMRAKDRIEIIDDPDRKGRKKVVPKRSLIGIEGWEPICEKRLPYELFASFLLLPDRPGVPRPIKLPDPYRPFLPLDKQLTEETGVQLAKWAAGDAQKLTADEKKIKALSDRALELAERLDKRDTVMAAIAQNRRKAGPNLKGHITWLERTIDAAEQQVGDDEPNLDAPPELDPAAAELPL